MVATRIEPMVWTYNGYDVFFDPQTEMGSLTTMWEACGKPSTKRTNDWLEGAQAKDLLFVLAENLNTEISCILEKRPGRNGGTWAHWQIATVYAHYLDPHFYLWWNEQARAHIVGEFVLTPQKFDAILTEMGLHFRAHEGWSGKAADIIFQVRQMLRQEPVLFGKAPQIEPVIRNTPVLDPKTSGVVYLFRVENKPEQYKIGSTQKSVIDRAREGPGQTDDVYIPIKEIQTNDAKKLERKLQNHYKKRTGRHIVKELFRFSSLDVKLFLALNDYIDANLFSPDMHLSKAEQDSMNLFS